MYLKKLHFAFAALLLTLSGCASTENTSISTFARFVPERLDDFAWENDLVAFRAYGPALRTATENSGVDCWLKRVNYPIINLWYQRATEQNIPYHIDHGEGLDNYHVGSSAGCGSDALWLDGQRQPLETFVKWEIVKQEKAETIFNLYYEMEINGDVYKKQKQITIKLGSRLFSVESTYWKNGKLATALPVTLAVSTHDGKGKPDFDVKSGYLSVWEKIEDSNLGTGIKVEPSVIQDVKVINDPNTPDDGHVMFITSTDQDGKVRYSAGYGWSKAGVITSEQKWLSYLKNYQTH